MGRAVPAAGAPRTRRRSLRARSVIEVDTTTPVEPGPLIAAVRAAAGAPSAR